MSRPHLRPIKRLLIANRGEIATRILSTARELGIETYCLYTTDDASHTSGATRSIELLSPASYSDISKLIAIVQEYGIDAVHPGYGFLSESAVFSKRMWYETNAVVIGPGWEILERTGDKLAAKLLAEECQVPTLPASDQTSGSIDDIKAFAESIGYPVIVKAVDGGGGRGIRIAWNPNELSNMTDMAMRESPTGKVFVEKAAVDHFRHIEVQIVGDGHGNVRHLWERDCSIQRRFQKIVEFAPSSIQDRNLVARVIEAALRMAKKVEYISLGTFEFLVSETTSEFFFLEVNPRLQVEHTITESLCYGIDLVKIQLDIASGSHLSGILNNIESDPKAVPPLHSMQLRITAEDPAHNWSLSVGRISSFVWPTGNGIRLDTHMLASHDTIIKTDFDSLLAKVIITAPSWKDIIEKSKRALADIRIDGVKTNIDILKGIVDSQDFQECKCHTQWLECKTSEILDRGTRISANQKKDALPAQVSRSSSVTSSSNIVFRKGDAWAMTLEATDTTQKALPGHLEIIRVMRNEFPQMLKAAITYTTSAGNSIPYIMSINATSATARAVANSSQRRRGDSSNSNHVIVPVPGDLIEILVEVNDVVSKNDVLAVLRQMKMELEIRASKGGRVVWIFDMEEEETASVTEGLLLVELETSKL